MKTEPLILTDANFASEVLTSPVPVLVFFWAPWCGPSLSMSQVIADMADTYKADMVVGTVDVDDNYHTAKRYNILTIPTTLYFHKGKPLEQVNGVANRKMLERRIKNALIE